MIFENKALKSTLARMTACSGTHASSDSRFRPGQLEQAFVVQDATGQAGARIDSALPFRASLIFTLSEVAYLRQQMPLVPQPQLAESCRPTDGAMCDGGGDGVCDTGAVQDQERIGSSPYSDWSGFSAWGAAASLEPVCSRGSRSPDRIHRR
jgi:hypothetical protein